MMSNNTKTAANKLFNDIAARVHKIAGNGISEEKARQGAKRLINFCQKLIDIEIRIENEKETKNE